MARRFFPGQDPLGNHLALSGPPDEREIVGVVADVKHNGLDTEVKPESYIPYYQTSPSYLHYNSLTLVARTAGDPENLINAVRSEVRGIDQDQPVYNIKPMEQVVFDSVGQRFFNMFLMTNFSIVALILAAIGIYGVIAAAAGRA
jgi:hypothetical protein